MSLEEALQEHEETVETLLKRANKYVGALKTWKKSCETGRIGDMQKWAAQAEELCGALPEATEAAKESWTFDARDYLSGDAWRKELQEVAAEKFSLRTLDDDDTLISSPVSVRAQPSRLSLQIGRLNWPALRPKVVAEELRRLRDKTTAANSQEFLESLFGASQHLLRDQSVQVASSKKKKEVAIDGFVKFRDIYELFCLTPGYKKDNPLAAFGQQIYALHRSELRVTRGGRKCEFEYASGNYKERDLFTVSAEDGRPIRYYGLWFK